MIEALTFFPPQLSPVITGSKGLKLLAYWISARSRRTGPGGEVCVWYRKALLLLSTLAAGAAPLTDYKGYKDPAVFSRMPNFYLSGSTSFAETQFDYHEFLVKGSKPRPDKQRVEGHKTVYYYYFDRSVGPPPSGRQLKRNYQAAAAKVGGQILYEEDAPYFQTTLRITRNGQETWAELKTATPSMAYYLTIVERQAMKQDIVANADAFRTGLAESGHVEVPGIFFDFGKSEVKPESEAALREVAKLLQGSPALRVWVVGHTDSVGAAETNLTLSGARAAAVVSYLTQKLAIDARRLTPFGAGPYAPVATNASEDGRAKNRRVELVAQP